MSKESVEIEQLLGMLKARGFQPQGVIFYDPKLKLLGLATLEGIPDAWAEAIGKRLGNIVGSTDVKLSAT